MATEETTPVLRVAAPAPDSDENDKSSLKRKVSPMNADDHTESHTKRQRQHADGDKSKPAAPGEATERTTTTTREEEKKRGKRLFGGLLNTLSQTNTNSQHRKRQEIELKQQERLQKQRDEDDQKRAEKLSRIKEGRMIEQIYFEEQVLRNRHNKLLSLARLLKTKAKPHIYYLPWKKTKDQENTIEEQIREAKGIVATEQEDFKARKERHLIRYGTARAIPSQNGGPPRQEASQANVSNDATTTKSALTPAPVLAQKASSDHEAHDESGDVLVEAEEDMVIY